MNTPIRWNAPASAQVVALHARWKEVQKGLRLMMFGFLCLVLIAVPGLFLLQAGKANQSFLKHLSLIDEDAIVLGTGLSWVGALTGLFLLLLGQWQCLAYAPQRHGAKEMVFAGLFCLLLGPAALAAAHYLGGAMNYQLLADGLLALRWKSFTDPATLLQLIGVLLVVLTLVMSTGFLRAVVKCLEPAKSSRVATYFWFLAFLIGASVGLLWMPRREVVLGLGAGWAVGLLWQMVLVNVASKAIDTSRPGAANDQARLDPGHKSQRYSGLHRYTVRVKTE